MKTRVNSFLLASALVLVLGGTAQTQQANMTFFVTSAGPGKGADLGGLEGADRHCQSLAQAAPACSIVSPQTDASLRRAFCCFSPR